MDTTRIPTTPGVYLFKNKAGEILYIGKAIQLKNRVKSYFQKNLIGEKTARMVAQIDSIQTIRTTSEFEALLLEAKLIRKYLPKYNVASRDDKHPLYIKITSEEYPKIQTVRREDDKTSLYFGPFPSSRVVKDTLRFVRSIFPYCTEKRIGNRTCFYAHLGLCNPCPNEITRLEPAQKRLEKRRYRHTMTLIKRLFSGKLRGLMRQLQKEMNEHAKAERYEQANSIKQQLVKLDYLTTPRLSVKQYLENPNLYSDIRERELTELGTVLTIPTPRRIEGYDISNTMGTHATGSMVTFIDGEAEKQHYRKFKIRLKKTPDDVFMMKEMLRRRLNHTEWDYPDLFLIDGGETQVGAAQSVLAEFRLATRVIGLAKQMEELVVPITSSRGQRFRRIRLPAGSSALALLQRVRDEAHRFARSYHLLLRKKGMLY